MCSLPTQQKRFNQVSDQKGRVYLEESQWSAECSSMTKSILLPKVEYLMLEDIAKHSRRKTIDFLREWIQKEYSKIKKR
jgi:aspartokinase-like uncharacterized kinase